MQTNDILTKPIPTLLKEIAVPASTGIIFNTFYNVMDTFYAGLISTNAVAGLSISFFLYFMIIGVGHGFAAALTALVGNALGKNKQKLAHVFAHKGIAFLFFLGVFMGIIGYMFDEKLLLLVGAKKEFLPFALYYTDVILLASPFFIVNSGLNAILVSVGDTKTYRNTLIMGFFANLILDPLFLYGIHGLGAMGIGGIALATVLIQVAATFYLLLKVVRTKLIYSTNMFYYAPKISIYKHIFSQGMPSALNMLTMSLGSIFIIHFVTTYGTKAIAGFGIAFRVEQIMLLPALGLNSAVLSIVSNNFGAKLFKRINECIRQSLFYGGILSVIGIALTYMLGRMMVSFFSTDATVIDFGMNYLYVEIFNFFGYVVLFIATSTLQGIKRPAAIFYVGLYRQVIAIVPIFWLISFYFKLPYMYLWFGLMFVIYSAAIFMAWHTRRMLKKI